MSKKLYVDYFSPDKTMAMTTNKLSISYNLVILDRFNDQSSPIFSVGRYVVMIWASNPPSMTFMDVKKNPELISMLIDAPEFASYRSKIASLLEAYNATYESTKDFIDLVLGESPAKPITED